MNEYVAFLEADGEASRPSWAGRLALIVAEYGEARGTLFPGGVLAMSAFEEARHSYVRGLYIAIVLLAQTSLEHMLAGPERPAQVLGAVLRDRAAPVLRSRLADQRAEAGVPGQLLGRREPGDVADLGGDRVGEHPADTGHGSGSANESSSLRPATPKRNPTPMGYYPVNETFRDEVMVDGAPTALVARSALERATAELAARFGGDHPSAPGG